MIEQDICDVNGNNFKVMNCDTFPETNYIYFSTAITFIQQQRRVGGGGGWNWGKMPARHFLYQIVAIFLGTALKMGK